MSAGCRVNREARSKLKPKAKNTRSQWRRGCSTRRSGRHPRPRRTRRTAPPVGRRWPAFESGRPAPECQQPAPAGYRPRFQPRRAVRPAVQVSWWGVGGEMVGRWWGVGGVLVVRVVAVGPMTSRTAATRGSAPCRFHTAPALPRTALCRAHRCTLHRGQHRQMSESTALTNALTNAYRARLDQYDRGCDASSRQQEQEELP